MWNFGETWGSEMEITFFYNSIFGSVKPELVGSDVPIVRARYRSQLSR